MTSNLIFGSIAIGCDHAAASMKNELLKYLTATFGQRLRVLDCGVSSSEERTDYPDRASMVAHKIQSGEVDAGIVLCGSGIGISIAANKHKGIRCALCHDHYTAMMCRQHNDANCLALGARVIGEEIAKECVQAFLTTTFEGGRHSTRVAKIADIENSTQT